MTDQATERPSSGEVLRMTADVVAAYVGNNPLATNDLPGVINAIHASLADLSSDGGSAKPPKPAVPIRRSVTPEFIICLEDGRKLKMLKRHLRTAYGMTPKEYREKWGLASDYPMVAPNYAQRRSELAKAIGLGTTGRGEVKSRRKAQTTRS